eukprot:jgi/Galph1/1856/GphlegSOOS_G537.1
MADYWVSQPRYYCQYCNTWIADNKIQRQQHENGFRHKNNVQNYLKNAHRENQRKKKESRDVEKEIRRIEEAARRSMYGERKSNLGDLSTVSTVPSVNYSLSRHTNVEKTDWNMNQAGPSGGIQVLGQFQYDEAGGCYDSYGGYYDRNGHYFVYNAELQEWQYAGWLGNNLQNNQHIMPQ